MVNSVPNHSETQYSSQPALDRIAKMGIFDTSCEGHQILSKIATKWAILIIYALTQGKKRYRDLNEQIVGVSPKMLVQTLRNLERSGLIRRDIFPSVPPRVDYSLTPLGESLAEPLAILGEWAYQHIPDVNAATEKYDNTPQASDFWEPK
ncbi:MAG: helix-turn-helix domain-containing protein [Leptolyngbyaceae bacterium]|nr:helix-turn-helix domain-containing protein [Leptolyngbyaceae bacterium]